MKNLFYIFTIILLVSSCRSAKENYNKGKYDKAIEKSLKELRADKDKRENKSIYNKSLLKLDSEILNDIDRIRNVEDKEGLYYRMNNLIDYYQDGSEYLDTTNAKRYIEMKDLATNTRFGIIDDLYQRGIDYLNNSYNRDDKSLAQQAYRDFLKLDNTYYADIENLDELIEESLTKAMMVIVFNIDANFNIMEQSDIVRKFSNLEGTSGYTSVFVNRGPDEVDCIIEIDFDRLDEDQSRSTERRNFSKQIEDGFAVSKDKNGNEIRTPIYKTITGYVDVQTVRHTFSWDVSADVKGISRHCDKYDKNFSIERYQDVISFSSYGDQNAIPTEYRTNRSQKLDKSSIIDDLLSDIYDEIRRYYL